MADHRVSDTDLERWVRDGIITSDQREAIVRELTARPAGGGIELTTLLYYGGGLLVLAAYSVFLGFQWEEMNAGGRIVISALSLVLFGAASQLLLRTKQFQTPGELLQVVAVAIVPLLTFALLDAGDLWPDDPGFTSDSARGQYQMDLAWARVVLALATLTVASLAFAVSRSPWVLIAALVSMAALVVDVSFQVQRPSDFYDYEWSTTQSVVVAAMGAFVFGAGVASRGRGERDYTTWLYVAGLVGLAAGLGTKTFPEGTAAGWGVLWMIAALTVLSLSIPLQQRLFVAAGLAAVFAYLAKLVFEVFESANAALVLAFLGMLVLGAGMLYQRFSDRVFAPRPSAGGHA